MMYLKVFAVGGLLCAIAQILIDKTKFTPAKILVSYVVSGVFLTAVGIYEPIVKFAGAGATVPIIGFGYSLCKGVQKAIAESGFSGIFTGGLTATAAGITVVMISSVIAALVFPLFIFKKKRKQ